MRTGLQPTATSSRARRWWAPPDGRAGASSLASAVRTYVGKWRGEFGAGPASRPSLGVSLVTCASAFALMGCMSGLAVTGNAYVQPVGSFGATAVLVFGGPGLPASQPRCVVGAQIVAALVGVGCRVWIADPMGNMGVALPLSVMLTLLVSQHLKIVNPPAGGTAAIAVIASDEIRQIGWAFVVPVLLWSVLSVLVACVLLNLHPTLRYPKYWATAIKPQHPPSAKPRASASAGASAAGTGPALPSSRPANEAQGASREPTANGPSPAGASSAKDLSAGASPPATSDAGVVLV